MFEEILVKNCAPTLAGLKTGSLFSCTFLKNDIKESIRKVNAHCVKKNIRVTVLKVRGNKALIYMYRPDRLKKDLMDKRAVRLLSERNYPVECIERCIVKLKENINNNESFPHEIGLFLGYPSIDVEGFIKNKAQDAKTVGIWKVYGDVQESKRRFDIFSKCTKRFVRDFEMNHSLDRLAVAV